VNSNGHCQRKAHYFANKLDNFVPFKPCEMQIADNVFIFINDSSWF
jgi:hypothetical protein